MPPYRSSRTTTSTGNWPTKNVVNQDHVTADRLVFVSAESVKCGNYLPQKADLGNLVVVFARKFQRRHRFSIKAIPYVIESATRRYAATDPIGNRKIALLLCAVGQSKSVVTTLGRRYDRTEAFSPALIGSETLQLAVLVSGRWQICARDALAHTGMLVHTSVLPIEAAGSQSRPQHEVNRRWRRSIGRQRCTVGTRWVGVFHHDFGIRLIRSERHREPSLAQLSRNTIPGTIEITDHRPTGVPGPFDEHL